MEISDLKKLLSKKTLKKQEQAEITRLASEYGIEIECTTCPGRWTTAIISIIKAVQDGSNEEKEAEILKYQYQNGVFIGGVFVCEQNAKSYIKLIELYAPNILNSWKEAN